MNAILFVLLVSSFAALSVGFIPYEKSIQGQEAQFDIPIADPDVEIQKLDDMIPHGITYQDQVNEFDITTAGMEGDYSVESQDDSTSAADQARHPPYVTLMTDFSAPLLGKLPLSSKDGTISYDLSKYIKKGTKSVLVYLFITARNSEGLLPRRSVYEVFTMDKKGRHYSQLMNVLFTTDDDFVINSANLWMPIFEPKLFIRLPAEWPIPDDNSPEASVSEHNYSNLAEAMEAFTQGENDVFNNVFLLGYR